MTSTLAIVDLETTSADVETCKIVEIACVLYSVPHRAVINVVSTLVQANENPAAEVNHIPEALLTTAAPLDRAFKFVGAFVAKADVIAAHFGDTFDRPVLEGNGCTWTSSKPWIDTNQVAWPRMPKSRSLLSIAHAHGCQIGVLHRAMDDCLLTARLFERAAELGADVPILVEKALRPRVTVQALVSYDDRSKAQEAGFQWDRDSRRWLRRMPIEDVEALGFPAQEVAA